ncbi:crotonase/enoyl-CoA hydratase family protein [Roseiterribacter gracilis]|uniref:Enoyl-CoA hydratase n=1 Tax=Roseiterribacter gracilis TaxID=2812848 RepID=A0A8S8XIE1_9PROT|nr:enoyl-CoA hydratase [Rhodospirillales bacterium TMPK1]
MLSHRGAIRLATVQPDTQTDAPRRPWVESFRSLRELEVDVDPVHGMLFQRMKPITRPSLTRNLISELLHVIRALPAGYAEDAETGRPALKYMVLASKVPGIFQTGGDLTLFTDAIARGERETMRRYAHDCIDIVHAYLHAIDLPLHMIALVQGDALGGGWEGALANDVIIAERSAKFAFPESLFNLFPGMGAYSMISRRLSAAQAEEMMLSGRIYTAEEMHKLGLVAVLAEDGQGEAALYDYIRQYERQSVARQSIFKARRLANPVTREELIQIVNVWVDAAMSLTPADVRKMQRLASAQARRNTRG